MTPKSAATEGEGSGAWRTIDSAPRDGTWVMVYPDRRVGGHGFTVAKYGSGHFGGMPGEVRHLTGWMSEGFFMGPQPTHWMPLPDPPANTHPTKLTAPDGEVGGSSVAESGSTASPKSDGLCKSEGAP